MLERLHGRLIFAIPIVLAILACNAPRSSISDRALSKNSSPSNPTPREPYLSLPDTVVDQGEIPYSGVPRRGLLLALSRWGSTVFAVLDASTKTLIPLATRQTDELLVSLSAGKVAYLVRDGFNPAKNYVEILDLKRKKSRRINPATDFAI